MSKHTKGPWKLTEADNRLTGKGKEFICRLEGMDRSHRDECRANATLIAAAPMLLKACDEADTAFAVLNICDDLTPQARKVLGEAWALVSHAMSLATGKEDVFAQVNPEVSKDAIIKAEGGK